MLSSQNDLDIKNTKFISSIESFYNKESQKYLN